MIDIILHKFSSKNYIYYTFKSKTSKNLKDLRIIFDCKNYCLLSIELYSKLQNVSKDIDTVKINLSD